LLRTHFLTSRPGLKFRGTVTAVTAAALFSPLFLGQVETATAAPGSAIQAGHEVGASSHSGTATSARQAAAAKPLIRRTNGHTKYLSPNGDHRLDQARIKFSLTKPARVKVVVTDDGETVRGPVRLGKLSKGQHVWKWNGRTDAGVVAPDRGYRVHVTAATATRKQTTKTYAVVDTVRPNGQLFATRTAVYPKARLVDDHARLVWVLEGWNPWDEEFFPEDDQPAKVKVEIRTRGGDVVWRRTARNKYTPTFDWYAKRNGRALRAGRYVAHVTVADDAGNRRRRSVDLSVSHSQLVEQTWTTTLPASEALHYTPHFGGCNGCPETCGAGASERFAHGLSFRPCPPSFGWHTAGYYGSDVPFPEAPVDSYRVIASGGPTTPGGADQGRLAGVPTNPGDASTATPWIPVQLASHPFLPDQDRPVTWTFTTHGSNSYDVATFSVEYRHYVPAG
jgi:hypothetical protein